MEPNHRWDVFISYSHSDLAAAVNIERALTDLGLNVWRDNRLEPARVFSPVIAGALRASQRVIVLWSANAVKSEWVNDEAAFACCFCKMVPVLLDDTAPPMPFNKVAGLRINVDKIDAPTISRLLDASADTAQAAIWPAPETYDEKFRTFHITSDIVGRSDEIALLDKAWQSGIALRDETAENNNPPPGKTNIVVFHAMGGSGKSALIHNFVRRLRNAGWLAAERVYVWSFYSQGTETNRQGSADEFFSHALRWFGFEPDSTKLSATERGIELARLVARNRTLLILDGLEPLQHPIGTGQGSIYQGALKDPGLTALLTRLATNNKGLCVVTTRIAIRELQKPQSSVIIQQLRQLSNEESVELMHRAGVRGTRREIERAAFELGNHALALSLLASYLTDPQSGLGGDVRRRDRIPSLIDISEEAEAGGHAKRVLGAYRIMFEERISDQVGKGQKPQDILAARQLALLYLIGVFTRPASMSAIDALIQANLQQLLPSIPRYRLLDLTMGLINPRWRKPRARAKIDISLASALAGLTPKQFYDAVSSLQNLGLINKPEQPHSQQVEQLDAHPLIREYFREYLAANGQSLAKSAHTTLYTHFKLNGLPEVFRSPEYYALNFLRLSSGSDQAQFRTVLRLVTTNSIPEDLKPNFAEELQNGLNPALERAIATFTQPLAQTREEGRRMAETILPSTIERMTSLFAAVEHGCAAGLHQRAYIEIFSPRIQRRNERYLSDYLGAHGTEVALLANFFDQPWSTPAASIPLYTRGIIVSHVAWNLATLGRVSEALDAFTLAAELFKKQGDATEAAINLLHASSAHVTSGDISSARRVASEAIALEAEFDKDESPHSLPAIVWARCALAEACFQSGEYEAARAHFHAAEQEAERGRRLSRATEIPFTRLTSINDYLYFRFLLEHGDAGEVRDRAAKTLAWLKSGATAPLHLVGLANLSLGLADLQLSLDHPVGRASGAGLDVWLNSALRQAHRAPAKESLDTAVEQLQRAGHVRFYSEALIARAWLHRENGDFAAARDDLQTAVEISDQNGMRLLQVDCRLELARLELANSTQSATATLEKCRRLLGEVRTLINATNYLRRSPDMNLVTARFDKLAGRGEAAIALLRSTKDHVDKHGIKRLRHELESLMEVIPT